MMDKEIKNKLNRHLKEIALALMYLQCRWEDEQGLEEFDEYREGAKNSISQECPDMIFISLDTNFKLKVKYAGWIVIVTLTDEGLTWKAVK